MSAVDSAGLGWYARRFTRMSPAEMVWRARDQAVKVAWSGRQVSRDQLAAACQQQAGRLPADAHAIGQRKFAAVLPAGTAALVPESAKKAVLAAADELVRGEWEVLGVPRTDLVRPDWFRDPVTDRQAPADRLAFRINHRSEAQTGNIKQVWEISRLQHLTLLATAWYLSHDEVYARRVADQLRSWWRDNPFLSGVHWTSGIEIGIRLVSLAWIRRLLDDWPEVARHFEQDEMAVRQIGWHQRYLATFRSRGSSANNHVIAEAAGQLVASCAFPWFRHSDRWRRSSARLLERELARNTFASGINREQAFDYQCFVAELGLLAAAEAAAAGRPLSDAAWRRLCATVDSGAALLDERQRPPRQGDGDEGRALLLDAQVANRWPSLLALGGALFGGLDWWPDTAADTASTLIGQLHGSRRPAAGPASRAWRFPDAGITMLRTTGGRDPEIWCRCDGGPHGFLSIAAHAHADALAIEVRYGGVDVLADPGTYCYHGEPAWRSYFRSTIAHNTLELAGQNSSTEGGPFLWLQHANGRELDVSDVGDAVEWTAEHDGYLALDPPARHRRCVRLDRASRTLDIVDEVIQRARRSASPAGQRDRGLDVRLAFHFGPEIDAEMDGQRVLLRWPGAAVPGAALFELPQSLHWRLHRGETEPVMGWYSCGLGRRSPAFTLVGTGRTEPGQASTAFTARLEFIDACDASIPADKRSAL